MVVETVAALLRTGEPTATSLVLVFTSAGEAASSLETWSCSLASCSFCQVRTDRMSGWTGDLQSACLLEAGGVLWYSGSIEWDVTCGWWETLEVIWDMAGGCWVRLEGIWDIVGGWRETLAEAWDRASGW